MASHQLIDAYLAELARRLPTDTVDELADGLTETWYHHLGTGLAAEAAARAAIAEFGAADRIADQFIRVAPGRRTARILLASGPIMAACWGSALVASEVWTWPIPPPAAALYAVTLLATAVAVVVAATTRRSYGRTRLGGVAAAVLVLLDLSMIGAVSVFVPTIAGLTLVAVTASLVRVGLAIRSLPQALTG
jgi:hypothetical protein